MTKLLKETRITILLSLNLIAILVVGVLILKSLGVFENSKVVDEVSADIPWNSSESENLYTDPDSQQDQSAQNQSNQDQFDSSSTTDAASATDSANANSNTTSNSLSPLPLWTEKTLTIYESADVDICIDAGLSNLGDMYWQTSDTSVIQGFYTGARTWLGYDSADCRYPAISGTGTVQITAGTYDGKYRDILTVEVIEVPVERWKREVLNLVNRERQNQGLDPLVWGETCASAATTRSEELQTLYSHTRPDGTDWYTACDLPTSSDVAGENLAMGNSAVSPETVVNSWLNSEKHRENILNPTYTHLAVGFTFDPTTKYRTYWSQFFSTY